jgi:hypothetical protein
MGFCGLTAGPGRWVGPTGSARKERDRFIFLFPNLFLMRKQFQKNLEIVLEAQKLLRKFLKFQENSQRHIGT